MRDEYFYIGVMKTCKMCYDSLPFPVKRFRRLIQIVQYLK